MEEKHGPPPLTNVAYNPALQTDYNTQYGPPPPPAYSAPTAGPPPLGVTADHINTQPVGAQILIVQDVNNSRVPCAMNCPHCHANIVTVTTLETATSAYLWCMLICFLGGIICCLCLIPFCVDSMKDVHHTCPNCKREVAICRR